VALQAIVKNGATTVATLNAVYPAVIAAGSVVNYTFQAPVATVGGTSYTVTSTVSAPGDQNSTDDSHTDVISIAAKPAAPAGGASICNSSTLLQVTNADPSTHYFWYGSASATGPIATGSSASTSFVAANNTFYVAAGASGSVGPASKNDYPSSTTNGDYQATGGNYLLYTAQVPVVLESVRLFTKYPGTVTIIAADLSNITSSGYSYSTLASQTINVYASNSNVVSGSVAATAADAADTGAVYYVNMQLPAGSHAIIVTISGASVFRNNNVSGATYPFALPNIISITGSSNASTSFYYYLYDMKVHTTDCQSDRTAVVATVPPTPVITQVGDSVVSSIATGNQWYLNSSAIGGATAQKYKPVQSGNYSVGVTDAQGCTSYSNVLNVTATAIVDVNGTAIGLSVSPNPSDGVFNISFAVTTRDDLKVEVLNMIGQTIYSKTYPGFTGTFNSQLDVGKPAAGIYILKIQHHNTWYLKKLLIK
jgi:hypothetical protein